MAVTGKTAVITGASGSGIGRSTALTLAREGIAVAINYLKNQEISPIYNLLPLMLKDMAKRKWA